MGVVYRARDARLARDVAVKVLHPWFAPDGPAANRFLGEARVTAQLQHPGVPPVHQVGALPDGRSFLVMKLIKGRTLADLLATEWPTAEGWCRTSSGCVRRWPTPPTGGPSPGRGQLDRLNP
jgi:serine/threonine protein kinase